MDHQIERRQEAGKARAAGKKQYVSQFPCKRGHFRRVLTSQGPRCPECMSYFNKLYKGRYDTRTADDHAARYRRYRDQSPEHFWAKEVVHHAKFRAKQKGLPFDLTVQYVKTLIVKRCPVLGLELAYGRHNRIALPNSPSLDRVEFHLGYVKGNVRVLSHRANTMRQNATIEELEKLVKFMRLYG